MLINVKTDYGATGNGTTDDTNAFKNAIAALPSTGGALYVPTGYYRISERLTVGKNVHLYGDNAGIRNLKHGETAPADPWGAYTGSVLIFESNVAGLFFPHHTDEEDTNTVRANAGATGSNATYWEYSGANNSVVERLVLYSRGGTSATAHGIEARQNIHVRDCIVFQFGGNGVFVSASADVSTSPATKYGNASMASFTNVFSTQNYGCGFRIEGRDANVIKLDNCNSTINGSWGFSDSGFLGNTYVNCHASVNNQLWNTDAARRASSDVNQGSFMADDINAPHVYLGCYSEGGNGSWAKLTNACQVLGGILSGGGQANDGAPFTMRGGIARHAAFTHYNARPSIDTAASLGSSSARERALAFGSSDMSPDLYHGTFTHELRYYSAPNYKVWSLEQPDAYQTSQIAFSTILTPAHKFAPFFMNGLFLGSTTSTVNRHIGFSASSANPGPGIYAYNDIVFKPAAAGGKIGWVCLSGGVVANNWVSGTVYHPNGSNALADYVTNAGKVYRVTAHPSVLVGSTVAPTHSAGTVTTSDGYSWKFENTTAVPVFKEFGAIDA
jgi:hypothetical protein